MLEEARDVYEVLDLNISKCHLAVAGLPGASWGSHRVWRQSTQMLHRPILESKGSRWRSLS